MGNPSLDEDDIPIALGRTGRRASEKPRPSSNTSAVLVAVLPVVPAAIRTLPPGSSVAVWPKRTEFMSGSNVKVRVAG